MKDRFGKIIGMIDIKPNGDKVLKDFYGKILGFYEKKNDFTKDFYGRILYKGDCLTLLLNNQK